jgi:hypothetical protein
MTIYCEACGGRRCGLCGRVLEECECECRQCRKHPNHCECKPKEEIHDPNHR